MDTTQSAVDERIDFVVAVGGLLLTEYGRSILWQRLCQQLVLHVLDDVVVYGIPQRVDVVRCPVVRQRQEDILLFPVVRMIGGNTPHERRWQQEISPAASDYTVDSLVDEATQRVIVRTIVSQYGRLFQLACLLDAPYVSFDVVCQFLMQEDDLYQLLSSG